MSILVKLAARSALVQNDAQPFEPVSPADESYASLRSRIMNAELTMARTQSSTSMGGLDYDADDNDHR